MVQNRLLFWFILHFVVVACKIDRKEHIDRDKFSFSYTDDSYLFFRNVRQIYYDITDLPAAKWIAYRHGDRYSGNTRPALTPVIVVDWAHKRASLLVETNESLQHEPELVIREVNRETGAKYGYTLAERGKENMLEFATRIYEGIIAENEIFIFYDGDYVPLFGDDDESDSFRVVLADYYRLTNMF